MPISFTRSLATLIIGLSTVPGVAQAESFSKLAQQIMPSEN